jgi:sulfate/thiosulfate-binding protein
MSTPVARTAATTRKREAISPRSSKNVPVLDTGARGSAVTFSQRGLGDVFLSWENEALLIKNEFKSEGFEIIVPSISILAEPPVAVVDKVAQKKGTRAVAEAYLKYLYSDEGQDIAGKNFYRPAFREGVREVRAAVSKGAALYDR